MSITKTAQDFLKLQPHQTRVVDKLEGESGQVAFHSLGAGKTLTSLSSAERALSKHPNKKVLFVVPASLVDNIYKEIDKHKLKIPRERLTVLSYEKAIKEADNLLKDEYSLVVADEAHRMRNTDTKRHQILSKVFDKADKKLYLTGTMNYNAVTDMAPLVNSIAGDKVLPTLSKEFDDKYVKKTLKSPGFINRYVLGMKPAPEYSLKNTDKLKKVLNKYVDYHNNLDTASGMYPMQSSKTIPVEMDSEQLKFYDYFLKKIPLHLRRKVEKGFPMTKQESKDLNAFATALRQVSNSVGPYQEQRPIIGSPKINTAVDSLANSASSTKGFRGLVYSNYLDAGLKPYAQRLSEKGVDYSLFTGELSRSEKKRLIDEFNTVTDRPRALLVSSSGGEGLDLKGVRKVQILDPHFNSAKLDQVIGRASRYGSHLHLPEDQRTVEVEHYHSVRPPSFWNKVLKTKIPRTIDQHLYDVSLEKQKLMHQVADLLKTDRQPS